MSVSADAPSLDLVYKLVRFEGRDVLKRSEGKETWVGAKQLYRTGAAGGRFGGDVLALVEEPPPPGAEPLLEPVMRDGRLLRPHQPVAVLRERCAAQLASLPEECRRLRDPVPARSTCQRPVDSTASPPSRRVTNVPAIRPSVSRPSKTLTVRQSHAGFQ
jgi:nicotinate phosphoribosyltransferase